MLTGDARFWVFFALGLLSLTLLTAGLILAWQAWRMTRHPQRIAALTPSSNVARLAATGSRRAGRWLSASPRLEKLLLHLPGITAYDRLLQQTGWPLSSAEAVVGSIAVVTAVLALGAMFGAPLLPTLTVAAGAAVLAQMVLLWQRHHRTRQLEKQLPDALALIARSMQAGHAFSSALQIAGQESPAPMGSELRAVFSEIQYGESANEALSRWAERVAGEDVRVFVIAVRIQSETGGNLAELLHQTAALIRERQKLRGVVSVLSAEGRISAVILTLLPFVLAGLLTALNPEFMAALWTDPLGIRLITLALLLMLAGMLWMWRLVRMQT